VPQLLALIRESVARVNPAASSGSGRDGSSPAQDLKSPGDCKAAMYAAGALMNMGGIISVQEKLMSVRPPAFPCQSIILTPLRPLHLQHLEWLLVLV
jgi:hypothetical protein